MAGKVAPGLAPTPVTEESMNTRTYLRPLAALAVGAAFLLGTACGAEAPAAQPEQPPEPAPAAVETAPSSPTAAPGPAVAVTRAQAEEPTSAPETTSAREATAAPGQPLAPEPTAAARAVPAESDTSGAVLEGSLTQPTNTPAVRGTPAVTDTAEQPTELPPPTAITVVEPELDIPVGTKEGDRVPDFALELVDGSTVTSADLQAMEQPVFLFFTATF